MAKVETSEYTSFIDINYGKESGSKLDVYIPRNASSKSPVFFFVFGGSWRSGSKDNHLLWGVAHVAREFVRRGYVVVLPNYRLSSLPIKLLWVMPAILSLILATLVTLIWLGVAAALESVDAPALSILLWLVGGLYALVQFLYGLFQFNLKNLGHKHPDHINDIADALKWTMDNIHNYQGDPNKIFLSGHSAGGHLASLVTLDPSYMAARGVDQRKFLQSVRGLVGISGVYNINRLHDVHPLAPYFFNYPAFGLSREIYSTASPTFHLKAAGGSTPALLLNAIRDHHLKQDAEEMVSYMKAHGMDYTHVVIPKTSHRSICFAIGSKGDKTSQIVDDWMKKILESTK